jgi:hypothetical protein
MGGIHEKKTKAVAGVSDEYSNYKNSARQEIYFPQKTNPAVRLFPTHCEPDSCYDFWLRTLSLPVMRRLRRS